MAKKNNLQHSQSTQQETEELMTVQEVAHQLRVDDTTVRRWIKSGALEALALPHRGRRQGYRVRKVVIDKLLKGKAS